MNNILVATDFSEASDTAAFYAANLTKAFAAKLTLLNVFSVPVPVGEAPVPIISREELENIFNEKLNDLSGRIESETGVKPSVSLKMGFAKEEIETAMSENKFDLVVMGLKGAGRLSELLVGSTSTSIIGSGKFPVLVIPENSLFHPVQKIVFACDYRQVASGEHFNAMKEIAKKFGSKIFILNFWKEDEKVNEETAIAGMRLEMNLEGIDHEFYFPQNNHVLDGLSAFVDLHGADLVVMIHHQHSLLHRIFNESETKKMAFHTHVPLLNLPEKKSV